MNNYKQYLIAGLIALTIAPSLWAADFAANVKMCPNPRAIVAAGLMTAEKDAEDGIYVAGQINTYNTQQRWAFIIGIPLQAASSEEDALNKARNALPYLSGNPSPVFYQGKWVCLYNDLPGGYKAIAVTPINFSRLTHSSLFKIAN